MSLQHLDKLLDHMKLHCWHASVIAVPSFSAGEAETLGAAICAEIHQLVLVGGGLGVVVDAAIVLTLFRMPRTSLRWWQWQWQHHTSGANLFTRSEGGKECRMSSRRNVSTTSSYKHARSTTVSKVLGRCKTTAARISRCKPSMNCETKKVGSQEG